jgi:hypothetical protein
MAKPGKAAAMTSVRVILFTWTLMEEKSGRQPFSSQYDVGCNELQLAMLKNQQC